MAIPDDDTLLTALKALRIKEPTLARGKVLKILKEENGWVLSEKRLKMCMDNNKLDTASFTAPVFKERGTAYHELLKIAVAEYTQLERDFILGLPEIEWKDLCVDRWTGHTLNSIVAHLRHHVGVAMTLKGIKPCALIHHVLPKGKVLIDRMINESIMPWFKKYKLASYGFALRQITHTTRSGNDVHFFPWGAFKQGWVFADLTSDVWPEVQTTLLHTTDRVITKADYEDGYCLHHDRMGKVFGYPMRNPRDNDMSRTVHYNDFAEEQFLNQTLVGGSCCVNGLRLQAEAGNPEEWEKICNHFWQTAIALYDLGIRLQPGIHNHPKLHMYFLGFTDEFLAKERAAADKAPKEHEAGKAANDEDTKDAK